MGRVTCKMKKKTDIIIQSTNLMVAIKNRDITDTDSVNPYV